MMEYGMSPPPYGGWGGGVGLLRPKHPIPYTAPSPLYVVGGRGPIGDWEHHMGNTPFRNIM